MKLVSIITVNYNQPVFTEGLLEGILARNTYENTEIIVVDNGSDKAPLPDWGEKFPIVLFVRSSRNLGFAGGNNLGVAAAKGDYLFFVNNDTAFTPGLVGRLVSTLDQHPEVGMVSPKIMYYDQQDTLQYAGFTGMNYLTASNKCLGLGEKDRGQYDESTGPTAYGHGAAMMVRREAIEKAGLMAENFFLYYEEMDWCERIRKAGFEIWTNMQAVIYHKESLSTGRQSSLKEYYMNRNRILFIRKNTSAVNYIFFLLYFMLVVMPRNFLRYTVQKQYHFIPVLMRAVWWNLTNSVTSNKLYFPGK